MNYSCTRRMLQADAETPLASWFLHFRRRVVRGRPSCRMGKPPEDRRMNDRHLGWAVALALVAGTVPVRADEATLPDGRRLPGKLTADAGGRFAFQSGGRTLPLANLTRVQLSETPTRTASRIVAPL